LEIVGWRLAMKFACKCGHVISDTTDLISYKAWFIPDEDSVTADDGLMAELATFIEARERGEEDQYWQREQPWIAHGDYPTLKEKLLHAFAGNHIRVGRAMYECEECGRIWMETRPDGAELVSYQPESASRGILRHQGATSDA
jgi:hypothetical protein